jgi:hypothetical protein
MPSSTIYNLLELNEESLQKRFVGKAASSAKFLNGVSLIWTERANLYKATDAYIGML